MPNDKVRSGIAGIGIYVPDTIVTNRDLEQLVDTSDAWIQSRTGIKERHIASTEQAASDLGVISARRAIENAGILPSEVDLIIVATATADMQFPSTACIIQEALGLTNIPAFDVTAGCAGFIYGLSIGSQFIENGTYRNVLVIGTEVLSKITNWTDRDTCVLLADGAGAVVLRPALPEYGLLALRLGAEGSGGKHLLMPAGGSRMPTTPLTIEKKLNTLHMNGSEVFKFAVRKLPEVMQQVLAAAKIDKSEVGLVIPHQANRRIIEAAARSLEMPIERFMINIDRYGNTSSASIPIAMHEALARGLIKQGDYIVLVGFGAGLTWGAVAMRWNMVC